MIVSVSHIALELSRVIELGKLKDIDISKRSGLSPSVISRIRSGKQKALSRKNFAALAAAVTSDRRVQAKLLAASIRDMCDGLPGWKSIRITVEDANDKPPPVHPIHTLPPSIERAFAVLIKECADDSEWCEIVRLLSAWLQKKRRS